MTISDFSFWPFFRNDFRWNPKFGINQNIQNFVLKINRYQHQAYQNFTAMRFSLAVKLPKTDKADCVTIWNAIFDTSYCRIPKQMKNLECLDKIGQERHVFNKCFFSKFSLFQHALFFHRIRYENGLRHQILGPNDPENMCHTTLILRFHSDTLFDLALTFT